MDVEPAHAIVDAGVLVQLAHVVHRARGLVGVQGDLAGLVDRLRPERPEQGQQPGVVVRVPVAHRHPVGVARLLQPRPRLQELFPRVGEGGDAHRVEPVAAIVHHLTDVAERHRLPLPLPERELLDRGVPPAALLAHLLGDVGDIEEAVAVEPLLLDPRHVHRGLALHDGDEPGNRRSPRRDDLVVHLDPGLFLVPRGQDVLEVLVELLHEGALAEEGDLGGLGHAVSRTPGRRDGGTGGPGRGQLEEVATRRGRLGAAWTIHECPLLEEVTFASLWFPLDRATVQDEWPGPTRN